MPAKRGITAEHTFRAFFVHTAYGGTACQHWNYLLCIHAVTDIKGYHKEVSLFFVPLGALNNTMPEVPHTSSAKKRRFKGTLDIYDKSACHDAKQATKEGDLDVQADPWTTLCCSIRTLVDFSYKACF